MNDQRTKPSPLSSYTDSFSSYSSLSLPTSQTDVITIAHEPDDTTGHPHSHQCGSNRLHPSPLHPLPLCAQDRRSSPRKIDPFLAQPANDHLESPNPVPETENTSTIENSAAPWNPTTPTPTTTTLDTTAETTTTTLIEESHDTVLLFQTLPPTPTEENETLFDNLTVLLFELIITVYLYHRRREHRARQ